MRLAAALIVSLPAAAATVRGPADVETLAAASEAVVHARVLSQESRWGGGGESSGVIYTRVLLRPLEWWKGGGAAEAIVVSLPGGTVGDLSQTVQGVATFTAGEEVVLFLRQLGRERTGLPVYDVERLALGKFSVGGLPGRPLRAMRDRGSLACQGCRAGEEDDLALDALRDRVRRAALDRP